MEEEKIEEGVKEEQICFDFLPKDLKEKIWSDLEEKELFRNRRVCKSWKSGIENCRNGELKERYEKGKKSSEEHAERKHYYKDYNFTRDIFASQWSYHVGLECCYGDVWCGTHNAMAWFCLWCLACRNKRITGRRNDRRERLLTVFVPLLLYPFLLFVFLVGIMFELLRMSFWLATCCFCFRRRGCVCRSKDNTRFNQTHGKKKTLLLPTRKEVFPEPNKRAKHELIMVAEEEVSCGVATAIFFYGSHFCSFYKYKKCF